ncbi:hypothetical protein B5F54_15935 [Anaeromassilibacillus sp. An250]|nr:hypothetical protein B5F54_15935 [Anaeromassilibacillus sp. An250]
MLKGISDGVVFYHLIFQGKLYFRAYHISKRGERFTHSYALKRGAGYRQKSVRRTRSHRMKFCVQRGLGALPSTSSLWQMDSHKHCLPETKTIVMLLVTLHKIVNNSNIRR